VQLIVSDHDLAADIPGDQNVWIQQVGCGTANVNFSSYSEPERALVALRFARGKPAFAGIPLTRGRRAAPCGHQLRLRALTADTDRYTAEALT
jgi:hypothetical protein